MRNRENETPREAAHLIVMGWIEAVANGNTDDLWAVSKMKSNRPSEAFGKQVLNQLEKIYVQLAKEIGADVWHWPDDTIKRTF